MEVRAADYTGTVTLRRSSIPLLCALVALLGLPASAFAETDPPVNTTPVTPAAWQTAPYAVALSGTDAGSGLDKMQWKLDGSAPTDAVDGEIVTISTSGVHTFETRAVDLDGNFSLWRVETLRIDRNLPFDSTDSGTPRPGGRPPPASWSRPPTRRPASTTWSGSSTAARSRATANGTNVPIAGDGAHVFRTRAVDVAGNASAWIDHTVRVDTVTPTDDTAAPAGWQTGPLQVSVVGSDAHSGVATLTWQVDGGAPQLRRPAGHRDGLRRRRAPPSDARHRRRRPPERLEEPHDQDRRHRAREPDAASPAAPGARPTTP